MICLMTQCRVVKEIPEPQVSMEMMVTQVNKEPRVRRALSETREHVDPSETKVIPEWTDPRDSGVAPDRMDQLDLRDYP